MILCFGKEKVDSIQEDRASKMKFAIQSALYKVTGSCDWSIDICDEVTTHKGNSLYELDVKTKRTVAVEMNSMKREYREISFKIVSEALTMKELFIQSVIEVRKCLQ